MKKTLLVALALALTAGCAKGIKPVVKPTTIQDVTFAVKSIQIEADAAATNSPALLSAASQKTVDTLASQALADIQTAASGWKAVVSALLTQLQQDLPAADYNRIALWVGIAQGALAAVPGS